jgi:hypothetical protein
MLKPCDQRIGPAGGEIRAAQFPKECLVTRQIAQRGAAQDQPSRLHTSPDYAGRRVPSQVLAASGE